MDKFADNLKKYRLAKSISQDAMAKLVGVHSTHVSRYERGLSVPSIEVVQKIANALELSIDQLVYGEQDLRTEASFKDRELFELFKKVQRFNEKQKDVVKDLISAYVLKSDLQKQLTH